MQSTFSLQHYATICRGTLHRIPALTVRNAIFRSYDKRTTTPSDCWNKVLYSRLYSSSSSPSGAQPLHVFAACLPGLEGFLNQELVSLGFQTRRTSGGVHFEASNADELNRCHLWCGTASNIYLRATGDKPFRARGMAELKKHVTRLSFWEECMDDMIHLPSGLDIRVKSSKSKLFHTAGIAQRVEEGIYSALGEDVPKDESKRQQDGKKLKVIVKIYRDEVEVSVDTSATPIHQRGYRLETGKAPLREDLAFALLYSTQLFGRNANDWSLLDPFCGSGTIPIEAAAMAHNLPPGRLREAPLQGLKLYDPDGWNRLVESAVRTSRIQDTNGRVQILGTDRNEGAIAISKRNAARAGVDHLLTFRHQAISSNEWFENPSTLAPNRILVACNPPFGHRISNTNNDKDPSASLLPLIQTLGHKVMTLGREESRQVAVLILGNNPNLIRRSGIPNLKVSFVSQHGGLKVFGLAAQDVVK